MNRLLVTAVSLFAGNAGAAEFGEWNVETDRDFVIAATSNDSESSFGFLCLEDGCGFYLSTGSTCKAEGKYPLLINAPTAANYVEGTCLVFDEDRDQTFFLMIDDEDGLLARAIKERGEIGFAIALQSGKFAVSRFSLNGAEQAVDQALRSQTRLGRENSRGSRSRPVLSDDVL